MQSTSDYMLSNHTNNNNNISLSIQYYQIIATYSTVTLPYIYIGIYYYNHNVINVLHNMIFSVKLKSDLKI